MVLSFLPLRPSVVEQGTEAQTRPSPQFAPSAKGVLAGLERQFSENSQRVNILDFAGHIQCLLQIFPCFVLIALGLDLARGLQCVSSWMRDFNSVCGSPSHPHEARWSRILLRGHRLPLGRWVHSPWALGFSPVGGNMPAFPV